MALCCLDLVPGSGLCVLVVPMVRAIRPVLKHGPRSLMRVRVHGLKTCERNESDSWEICTSGRLINCERFELEHTCQDPKDGELCLWRLKPQETAVEDRSDTDVQIVRHIWV